MKQLLAVWLLALLSCNESSTDQVKSFIPGTYCKKVNNEFSKGFDTLVISVLNENIFRVVRNSSFRKTRNGLTMPAERHTEIWIAIYNHDEEVLHETKMGKTISFIPNRNTLLVGSSEYKKIKK